MTGILHFDDHQYGSLLKEETFSRILTKLNPDKTPVNLTGYTAKMQIRKNFGDPIIKELTTENGGIIITPLTGKIELFISANDTKTLPIGKFLYDLLLIQGSVVDRMLQGEFHIKDRITVL